MITQPGIIPAGATQMSNMENAAKIREFLKPGLWRTREAIQKATGVVDHEWNEAQGLLFDLESGYVVRQKHDSYINVYRILPEEMDMFGNPLQ